MVRPDKKEKRQNAVLAILFLLVLGAAVALRFDFYYDLNDDVLMKDILAGVHSGEPDGHNIQMLYPVSLLISLCYRVIPGLPWYGWFLCGINFLCFYLIAVRSLRFAKGFLAKTGFLAVELCLILGLYLKELVFVQYTVLTSLMAACAVFLLYTTEKGLTAAQFIKKNLMAILLVVLAFWIRTEMLLLMLPFICAAGFLRWTMEKKMLARNNLIAYGSVIGLILAGMAAGMLGNRMAYGSGPWKEFMALFDERTELYDFIGWPEYEEHQSFYESIGFDRSEYEMLENYNFGLNDKVDAALLGQIREYQMGLDKEEKPLLTEMKAAVSNYIRRTLNFEYPYQETLRVHESMNDMPWNLILFAAYSGLAVTACIGRNKSFLWKIPFQLFCRSVSWMYILYRGRTPDRIIHPLYLIELLLVTAELYMEWKRIAQAERLKAQQDGESLEAEPADGQDGESRNEAESADGMDGESRKVAEPADGQETDSGAKSHLRSGRGRDLCYCRIPAAAAAVLIPALLGLLAAAFIPGAVRDVAKTQAERAEINKSDQAIREYCRSNPEQYYFLDVMSTVYFSEKMFEDVDNSMRNYDIIGGWATRSPVSEQAQAAYEIGDPAEALLDGTAFFIVEEEASDTGWLLDYYRSRGVSAAIEQKDMIRAGNGDVYYVFGVNREG